MTRGQESQETQRASAYQPDNHYRNWLRSEYVPIAGGEDEPDVEEVGGEDDFNPDTSFETEDDQGEGEESEEEPKESSTAFEHNGKTYTSEQLVEFLAEREAIETATGGAGFAEYEKWARQNSMKLAEMEKATTEREEPAEIMDGLDHLDPDSREALGFVNDNLIAPLQQQFNQQIEDFQNQMLDLIEPLIESHQLAAIRKDSPDLNEADLRTFAAQLSQRHGVAVPLRMAAEIMKDKGGFEKGKAQAEADLLRKKGAVVPSGGAKRAPKGLQAYDPEKDGNKTSAELLMEGLSEIR